MKARTTTGNLVFGPDRALYGTAFRIKTAGQFTTLHKFSRDGHGFFPEAALTLGPEGLFYGTTSDGGTVTPQAGNYGAGTVFSMTPTGQLTTLYKFHTNFDGYNPYAGVTFGTDGVLYGSTRNGGAKSGGTLYKLTLPQ